MPRTRGIRVVARLTPEQVSWLREIGQSAGEPTLGGALRFLVEHNKYIDHLVIVRGGGHGEKRGRAR